MATAGRDASRPNAIQAIPLGSNPNPIPAGLSVILYCRAVWVEEALRGTVPQLAAGHRQYQQGIQGDGLQCGWG